MARIRCYSGPNPIDKNDPEGLRRAAIWKWLKENHIDPGVIDATGNRIATPLDDLYDAVNQKVYGGVGKRDWIMDILGGRKTPFREQTDAAWSANYERRNVTRQAQEFSRSYAMSPTEKTLRAITESPRMALTAGHGWALGLTHPADLAFSFSPSKWRAFYTTLKAIYNSGPFTGARGKAYGANLLASIQRDKMYTRALRGGLEVGPHSRPTGIFSKIFGQESGQRAWEMLQVGRYDLWKDWMEKRMKPGMTEADLRDLAEQGADWANHATGSAKLRIGKRGIPGVSHVFFGPQLTGSKLARIVADPVKTLKTFANWDKATYGEQQVALTRLSGMTQYLLAYPTALLANQIALNVFGGPNHQNINFANPYGSDWWKFKAGGMEFGVPGLRTELQALGKILFTALSATPLKEALDRIPGVKEGREKPWNQPLIGYGKGKTFEGVLPSWAKNKLSPQAQTALELMYGSDWQGRPLEFMPQHPEPTAKKPIESWHEYLLSKAPIPLTGPIGFVYDKFRESGMNAFDAQNMIRAIIMAGAGLTGLHVKESKEESDITPSPPAPAATPSLPAHRKRTKAGQM